MTDLLNTDEPRDATTSNKKEEDEEEEIRIENYVNEKDATKTPQETVVEDLTSVKLAEATEKLDKLQLDNQSLQAQIEAQKLLDTANKKTHSQELAELFEQLRQQEAEQKNLQEERQKLLDEQNAFKKITNTIQTIKYVNIPIILMETYFSPYNHSILIHLKNVSAIHDPYFSEHLPQMTFATDHTAYIITLKGFPNHHDQFKKLYQRLQSLADSTQSAKEYYQRHSSRIVRALVSTSFRVQSTVRYWILYRTIFTQKLEEKRQEYLIMFDIFFDRQVKMLLIEKCISGELIQSWKELRKFTDHFVAEHPLFDQVERIKHETMDEFIKQNISFQRIQSDRKPTENSASTAKEMIKKVTNIFQTDPRYQGYELKHFQLIPSLLQRITIYYCCFALQLPLFESARDLLNKIENHTVTTIATTTGSG